MGYMAIEQNNGVYSINLNRCDECGDSTETKH